MKSLNPTIALVVIIWGAIMGGLLAYNHEQNGLNRQAYYECLRITEELVKAESDSSRGIRIVSTPTCRLP